MVSYAKKHHIKSLKYAGLERMNLKRNLHGVRNRLVAGHHMRSFMLPSLRKLRRMTAARAYCNRQFQYSSRFSTLTRVLSVYKRMSYQSHMKKMYMSLRNTVQRKHDYLFLFHLDSISFTLHNDSIFIIVNTRLTIIVIDMPVLQR